MHISRRGLAVSLSVLAVAALGLGGGWVYLHTVVVAEVFVDGGHVLTRSAGQIAVRADTPRLNLSLVVPTGVILTSQLLTIQNIASDRIQFSALPPGAQLVRSSATTVQVALPPLPAGIHRFSAETQPLHENQLTIALLGDSQGYTEALSTMVDDINGAGADFAIHLGDVTPSGELSQYVDAASALQTLRIPLYATPGNHDGKGNGTSYYVQFFGAQDVAFAYGGVYFVGLNTSSLSMNSTCQGWLEEQLGRAGTRPIVVYTHVPASDPRPGYDHGFLNSSQAAAFLALMNQYQVTLVMNGHIHLYNSTMRGDVLYLISGGAGAALEAPPDQGGFHHYVLVTIALGEIALTPVHVEIPIPPISVEIRNAANFSMTLGLPDLVGLATIQRSGRFQNLYGNFQGFGLYRGVLVSDLLGLVGGMASNQVLVAEAYDGYQQTYGYSNVYPNTSWYQLQGDFIVAFQYNATFPPQWADGPRLAFLPLDGTYSNQDCELTSYSNQGYHVYPSAGARWVRSLIRLVLTDVP